VQDKFDDAEGLQAIRRSLVDYGPEYGQDWSHIPFAFVHLKSAHMAQQPEYAQWSDGLYKLSRFGDAISLIEREVQNKGGFYRFKTYTDVVSVPLVEALEELFAQSAENSDQGRLLIQKKRKHDSWIEDFEKRAATKIETFLTGIADDLKREASTFAEDNYDNKHASSEWAKVVKRRDIQTRANNLLIELEHECEDELRDIGREIEFDIRFSRYRLNLGHVKARGVVDAKKVWNWTTVIVSGSLTIAGLFAAPQLVAGGVIAGVIGAVGSFFFDDFEERKKRARLDMQKQLNTGIDRSISQLRKQLNGIVADKIVERQLRPTSKKISDVVSSLFDLSATQRRLARRINEQQGTLSSAVVTEALAYLGYDIADGCIMRVARIPGETTLLILADGARLPYKLKRDLAGLLDEGVRYVFECGDVRVMLSRTIGRTCDRRSIRIEEVKGEPLIAHIKAIDELGNEARTGIRLGAQVTELLITR
jgi:gas vesicle protein